MTQLLNKDIKVLQLFPVLAVSGCDSMACYSGIGKIKTVKTLEAGNELKSLGNTSSDTKDIIHQSTASTAACNGQKFDGKKQCLVFATKCDTQGQDKIGACLLPKLET